MKFRFICIFTFLFCLGGKAFASALPYDDIAWLKLLHYGGQSGQYRGLVANDEFYVSEEGRYNPEAEMQAEITEFANMYSSRKCDFPARFNWLKERGLLDGDLQNCEDYQRFWHDVGPEGITLLFTNAYMSNPASLFGHTLIRIDTARQGTQMLAHGVNFGANSGTDSGIPFAFKGLFGFYWGVYGTSPYWNVINEYNNIENRDIWEYHLNLTHEEKVRFVNHLYEMKNAQIQYYFLNKNCSYMILELLEAIRPELDLTSSYDYWAIPLDTIKTIKSVEGLIDDVNYRPARYTKIAAALDDMSASQYQAFKQGIFDHEYGVDDMPETEQSEVLETIYQYYQYQYIAHNMELSDYRKQSFAVLRRRSALPSVEAKTIDGEDPSLSHDSAQVSWGLGTERGVEFAEFSLRPAYTSLADDNYGMIRGAGVTVLENSWRYYWHKHRLYLQDLTLLNVRSLVPANNIFSPLSYVTNFSLHREFSPQTIRYGYVGDAYFGLGKTYALYDEIWLYGLLQIKGQYGGFLPHNQWGGIAPEVGIFSDLGRTRLHAYVQKIWSDNDFADRLNYHVILSLGLSRNVSVEAKYKGEHCHGGTNNEEVGLALRYYF